MHASSLQLPTAPPAEVRLSRAATPRWLTIAGLALLIAVGGVLRLRNLAGQSVSHVEMYVPGIRLPHGISVPEERLTLLKTVTSTLNSDTHPPGYYMVMWAWTRLFGTSVWSIRLPSVLFGTACIPLVWWLGSLTGQTKAAWIAAGLLAINGQHIFWSQEARMFTLACFLGLLSTILLLRIARQDHASRWLQATYVAVLLAGVCTHVFFWLILASHMTWTAANAWRDKQPMPGALRLQFVALILGSPLLAFSAYQNGNTLATLSSNTAIYARELVQFAFAFPLLGYSSGLFGDYGRVPDVGDAHLSPARWLFFGLSAVLFLAGCIAARRSQPALLRDCEGPSEKVWLRAGALGTLAIIAFLWVARAFAQPNATLGTTQRMSVLPLLLALAAILVQRYWAKLSSISSRLADNLFLTGEQALVLLLAVLPFLLLALISLFKPIFNARGLVVLTPYTLLVLAAGIVRLGRHPVVLTAILAVVTVAHLSGLRAYRSLTAGRADYQSFATQLAPQIQPTDLIFLYPEFYSTPLFFYLHSDWDRAVARNYEAACHANPKARVWALWFDHYEPQLPVAMQKSLVGYQVTQRLRAEGGQAILYVPNHN